MISPIDFPPTPPTPCRRSFFIIYCLPFAVSRNVAQRWTIYAAIIVIDHAAAEDDATPLLTHETHNALGWMMAAAAHTPYCRRCDTRARACRHAHAKHARAPRRCARLKIDGAMIRRFSPTLMIPQPRKVRATPPSSIFQHEHAITPRASAKSAPLPRRHANDVLLFYYEYNHDNTQNYDTIY